MMDSFVKVEVHLTSALFDGMHLKRRPCVEFGLWFYPTDPRVNLPTPFVDKEAVSSIRVSYCVHFASNLIFTHYFCC